MKTIISGVLRIALTLMFSIQSFINLIQMNSFEKFPSASIGHKAGLITILLMVLNLVFYMIFNAVRDFNNKPIRLKPFYIIFLLTTLIAIMSIMPIGNIPTGKLILLLIYAVLIVYFIINDFICLWLKKSVKIDSN
jgi:hypothetical protein